METHSGILAWRSSWTEKPGRLQSMGSQKSYHIFLSNLCFNLPIHFQRMYALFMDIFLNLGNFCLFSNTNLLEEFNPVNGYVFFSQGNDFSFVLGCSQILVGIFHILRPSLKFKEKERLKLSLIIARFLCVKMSIFSRVTCSFQLHL